MESTSCEVVDNVKLSTARVVTGDIRSPVARVVCELLDVVLTLLLASTGVVDSVKRVEEVTRPVVSRGR